MRLRAEIEGHDWVELAIELDGDTIQSSELIGRGCPSVLKQLEVTRKSLEQLTGSAESSKGDSKGGIASVPLPEGDSHGAMLVREVLLKARGEWKFPYTDDELCHCRMIPTKVVDKAVLLGASAVEDICRRTSAGTGCGTCRVHSEEIIKYRRGG